MVIAGKYGFYVTGEPRKVAAPPNPKKLVTVGRKKRKRKRGAGSGVKIKSHTRSPRGPNKGKKPVRVDGHARGKPPRRKRRKR